MAFVAEVLRYVADLDIPVKTGTFFELRNGVINVSPESFSGDGVADADAAIARPRQLVDEGADMLDIGARGDAQ